MKPIWERDGNRGMVPGSTTKLLTAAAALLSLNPTDRLATRVVPGPTRTRSSSSGPATRR